MRATPIFSAPLLPLNTSIQAKHCNLPLASSSRPPSNPATITRRVRALVSDSTNHRIWTEDQGRAEPSIQMTQITLVCTAQTGSKNLELTCIEVIVAALLLCTTRPAHIISIIWELISTTSLSQQLFLLWHFGNTSVRTCSRHPISSRRLTWAGQEHRLAHYSLPPRATGQGSTLQTPASLRRLLRDSSMQHRPGVVMPCHHTVCTTRYKHGPLLQLPAGRSTEEGLRTSEWPVIQKSY